MAYSSASLSSLQPVFGLSISPQTYSEETGKYENEKASANPKHGWYPSGSSHELWNKKATGKYKDEVYVLPKHLDEKVAALHLRKLGAKLAKLTKEQSHYLNIQRGYLLFGKTTPQNLWDCFLYKIQVSLRIAIVC
ncbi:S-adenosyl-L-homocysteine hydrolase [Tanacetum coccineum]